MAKRKPSKKIEKGAKRMSQLGYRPVQIWLSQQQLELIQDEARRAGRMVSNFVRWAALTAANDAEMLRRHMGQS